MSMIAVPAILQTMQPDTLDWVRRQTVRDDWGYISAVDQLIFRGKLHGWWNGLSELWIMGSDTRQAALEGIKGVINYADLTFVGNTLVHVPRYGIKGDDGLASHISTNLAPLSYPGVTLDSHSLWAYLTSNEVGSFQIIGSAGSGGLKNFMLRASSSFKAGAWAGADQFLFGGSIAEGFVGFCRTGHSSGFTIKSGKLELMTSTAVSMPTHALTLFSAETAAGETPQRANMLAIGSGSMTSAQGLLFNEDCDEFQLTIGIWDDIQVPPEVQGPNAFGKSTYQQVIPATRHVIRQSLFPTSSTFDAADYLYFPITDAVARSYTKKADRVVFLGVNPLETTIGTNVLRVTDIGHAASVNDAVKLVGATSVGGLSIDKINRWFAVDSIVSPDIYTVRTSTNATSSAIGGGSVMTSVLTRFALCVSTFVPPRDGVHWALIWSPRGERDGDDDTIPIPVGAPTRPNDTNPNFNRETDPFKGIACRPAYKTKRRAVGALLVQTAYTVGYLDRDEPGDPLGQGYLDIAEEYDLDPQKVLPWVYFAANREDIYTISLDGFAVCYDYVNLDPRRLIDNLPYFPRLGLMMDMEHSDYRAAGRWEVDLKRWCDICKAKDIHTGWLGHDLLGTTAASQGFTSGPGGNMPRIVNYANLDLFNIRIGNGTTPADKIDFINAQLDYCRNAAGYVPMHKVLLSCVLGLGQKQISLADAERVGNWGIDPAHQIDNIHISRLASPEGGDISLFRQQQMVRYLPNITDVAPPSGADIVLAWITVLASEGADVSPLMQALLTAFIGTLIDAEIWSKLDVVFLPGETQEQQLKCLKRIVSATLVGAAAPTFVAKGGFTYDGAQNHTLTGFIPSAATAMTGVSMMLGAYEETNVATDTTTVGGYDNTADKGLSLRLRGTLDLMQGQANSDFNTQAGATDSREVGYVDLGGGVWTFGRGTVDLGTFVPATSGTVLPTKELVIGASNSNGVIDKFRAAQISAIFAGAHLTLAERTILTNAFHTYRKGLRGWVIVATLWTDAGVWDDTQIWAD